MHTPAAANAISKQFEVGVRGSIATSVLAVLSPAALLSRMSGTLVRSNLVCTRLRSYESTGLRSSQARPRHGSQSRGSGHCDPPEHHRGDSGFECSIYGEACYRACAGALCGSSNRMASQQDLSPRQSSAPAARSLSSELRHPRGWLPAQWQHERRDIHRDISDESRWCSHSYHIPVTLKRTVASGKPPLCLIRYPEKRPCPRGLSGDVPRFHCSVEHFCSIPCRTEPGFLPQQFKRHGNRPSRQMRSLGINQ
jgi:hypothetical protein